MVATAVKSYTKEEFIEILAGIFSLDIVSPNLREDALDEAIEKIDHWLARGDGVAVYENHELGHPELGHKQVVSFGSHLAQLEVYEVDLPVRLPDIGGRINWRYLLVGVYTGEAL